MSTGHDTGRAEGVAIMKSTHGWGRRVPFSADFQPRKVVYAISLRSAKPLLVDNLFTFAQVTFLHAVTALRNVGIEVAVVDIRTVEEPADVAA